MTKYLVHLFVDIDDKQTKTPKTTLYISLLHMEKHFGIKKLEVLGTFELK